MDTNASTIFSDMQVLVKSVVYGEPASKANSRRLVRFGGVSRLIKSQKALTYGEAFKDQLVPLEPLLEGDLVVVMWIYYASRRPDLDESLILDLMQGVFYKNDRQVKEKHIYWGLDRDKPRVEIVLAKKDPQGGGSIRRGNHV